MINTAYATLYQTPKALDSVCMGTANNILASSMIAASMPKTLSFQWIIDCPFIGIDHCPTSYILGNQRHDSRSFDVGSNFNIDLAIPLSNADHRDFVGTLSGSTLIVASSFATDVCFIYLYFIGKHIMAFVKKCADLLKHSPSCLVGYTSPALQFFSRMTTSSSSHPEHSLKPNLERCAGLVENSSGSRINFMSAEITFITRPFSYFVVFCNLIADWAFNAVREPIVLKPFKTSIIIGKFLIKMFGCVFGLFRFHFLTLTPIVYHINHVVSRDTYLGIYFSHNKSE